MPFGGRIPRDIDRLLMGLNGGGCHPVNSAPFGMTAVVGEFKCKYRRTYNVPAMPTVRKTDSASCEPVDGGYSGGIF